MADTVGNLLVKIGADVSGLTQASAETNNILRRLDQTARTSAGGFGALSAAVITVNQGLGLLRTGASTVAAIGQSFFAQADAASALSAQIRLVSASQAEASTTQRALLELANQTRTGLEETATLYARVARSSQALGLSQQDLIGLTRVVNQALVVGGASASEAAAGVLQLSQAIGAGALQGDELRSVLENMPVVANILAQSLGVTIGQLKQLGSTGAITSKVIVASLLGASEQVGASFAKVPTTAAQAFTVLQNETLAAVAEIDRATGATKALVDALEAVKTAALAALPAIVENMKSTGESARELAASLSQNRSQFFTAIQIGATGASAALLLLIGRAAATNAAFQALAAGAAAINPLILVLGAASTAFALFGARILDTQRNTAATEESFGRLAVATARAHARGQELTSAQRAAILAGQDFNKVFAASATQLDATGTAATNAATKINTVGDAITKAVQKAQTDIAIFGQAVGSVPLAAAGSFTAIAANINRSSLAMASLSAQSATLISSMQALDTSTAAGAEQFAELDKQLKAVRANENIVFKADLGDLKEGLKTLKEEIDKGVDPVKIKADADALKAMGEAIKAQIAKTNDEGLKVELNLLLDKFNKGVDDAMKKADTAVESFYDRLRFHPPANIKVSPEFRIQEWSAELAAIKERIITADPDLKLKLKADAADLEKKIADEKANIKKGETLPIDGDTTKLDKKLDEVEERVQTITLGFGKITGDVATGADVQNTIERLRSDLVAAIQAGDTAAQARLRAGGLQFVQTFGPTGGITSSERKQILDIIGPFASVGQAQLIGSFARQATALSTLGVQATQTNQTQKETNRLQAENNATAKQNAQAAARTAVATEQIAKTMAGGFGGVIINAAQNTAQRITGNRGPLV